MAGITAVPTSVAAFVGVAPAGALDLAVQQFLANGGSRYHVVPSLIALDALSSFNLLCLPGVYESQALNAAAEYCNKRGAFLIADTDPRPATAAALAAAMGGIGLTHPESVAVYGPWLRIADPLHKGQTQMVAPSGSVAGVYARTDLSKGVWAAPAGLSATVNGVMGLAFATTDAEEAQLAAAGLNPIRQLPAAGIVVWGARTMAARPSEFEYVPVRRLLLFIQQSVTAFLESVRLAANNSMLWTSVRGMVANFLTDLWRQGGLRGTKPAEAFFVSCGLGTTMTATDILEGRLIVEIGCAPVQPAEFVAITIQQMMTGG